MAKRTPSEVVLSPYLICRHRFRRGDTCRDSSTLVSSLVKAWTQLVIHDLPTLLNACTVMPGASMSLRSRSASYLRSLEALNLGERPGQSQCCLSHFIPPTWDIRPDRNSPQSFLSAPQVILHYDASHCAALAHASSIPNQEPSALPTGQ